MEKFAPLVIIIIVIIIFVLFYFFNDEKRIIRRLSKIPYGNINNLTQNKEVKITGVAININKPLIAPFSKRKCVFYSILIEEEKGDEENSSWKTLVKEEKIQDFLVHKKGNYVLVKPKENPINYISYLVVDNKISSGTFNNPSPEFITLLNKYNIKSTGFLEFNKQLRYSEGIIELNEEITIAGNVKYDKIQNPIPNYSYSSINTFIGSKKNKLIITDLPKENLNKK